MIMKKLYLGIFVVSVLTAPLVFSQAIGLRSGRNMDYVPEPRLISPVTQEVVLTGKEDLEFRWSPHEGRGSGLRKYYDFRIYKGYEMVESTRIYRKKTPGDKDRIDVSADLFENGQIYTWSLRLGYKGIGKSTRSYQSFKTVK
ncbi:MAG: hypothetical protein U9R44_04945 [Candidatus Omnitrophota bacterium]|nr:hypothetical protein [Candidatus Omnitrophota bacterium]